VLHYYYQAPEFKESSELILPLEATYYEKAQCLGEEYDFYPGMTSVKSINKHVCEGGFNYETKDPNHFVITGDWQSFIYKYDSSSPKITTIPKIGGLNEKLTYRLITI